MAYHSSTASTLRRTIHVSLDSSCSRSTPLLGLANEKVRLIDFPFHFLPRSLTKLFETPLNRNGNYQPVTLLDQATTFEVALTDRRPKQALADVVSGL